MNLQKCCEDLQHEKLELQQKRTMLNKLLQEIRKLNQHLRAEKQEVSRLDKDEYILPDHIRGPEGSQPPASSQRRKETPAARLDPSVLDDPEHINTITLNLTQKPLDNTFKGEEEEFDDTDEELCF